MSNSEKSSLAGSFRDPNGFLFERDGILYRQVNDCCREDYQALIRSGLYEALSADGLLIPHEEVDIAPERPDTAYKIIRPEKIGFISYPYEWCFSQLRDAALATLEIEMRALDFGMSLKDASAYNIQFREGRPILIDTLSFERYREGEPWVAYRQFCRHFLAPLALADKRDIRLASLLRVNVDGVPLDLASLLLPWRTRLSPSLLTHLHLHARFEKRYADRGNPASIKPGRRVSRLGFTGLVDSLSTAVRRLSWQPTDTQWSKYYNNTNYGKEAMDCKAALVGAFLDEIAHGVAWDLGANTGRFSELAAERGFRTIAFDMDPAAVEKHYLECRRRGDRNILPLVLDLTNPSPSLGWACEERRSLIDRADADVVMALALIHHLAISNNVPLDRLARFLAQLGHWLVIEFVPKEDSQVQRLLAAREDVFGDYDRRSFEESFAAVFEVQRREPIPGTCRTLYLMRRSGCGRERDRWRNAVRA